MATICCTTRGTFRRPNGSSRTTSPRRMTTSPVSLSPFRRYRRGARWASRSTPVSFTRALELRLRYGTQRFEPGALAQEREVDAPGRAVPLLGDDDLRLP